MQYRMVSILDKDYPNNLKNLKPFTDPILNIQLKAPEELYYQGQMLLSELNLKKCVSIIGTRSPFHAAYEASQLLGRILGLSDFIIVSGYATGIDSASHYGAMDSNAYTTAVLGSGLNLKKPVKPALERYILEKGLFISEIADPDRSRNYEDLMARDRITACLSDAVIVVDTDIDGGAVHTAKIAKENNRKVYAIDWSKNQKYIDKDLGGNSQLIYEKIANPIDILDAGNEFEEQVRQMFSKL